VPSSAAVERPAAARLADEQDEEEGGKIASRPMLEGGERAPPSTPASVPADHAMNCGKVAPNRIPRSVRAVAAARERERRVHERLRCRTRGPRRREERPMAKPIGSQRAFISIPAAIAASAPPPAASTVTDANWAAPEHDQRHHHGRDGAHDRLGENAERDADGERRQDQRQPCTDAVSEVACLNHLTA
jgi:hypothetical protein